MPSVILYVLFFCSGLSGLIYQVVWVREFGNVFGNTVYSASLVVAIFMLGLGGRLPSSAPGRIDATRSPRRLLLRAHAYIELVIAALGFGISFLLPVLAPWSPSPPFVYADASGWHVPSGLSHAVRGRDRVVLLTPMTS
jgi:spermidine synthase